MKQLKWLSGIVDSDGYIGITRSHRKNDKTVFTPNVCVTNSNSLIIDEVVNIYKSFDIGHHVKKNGTCYVVTVSRPTMIIKLLDLIQPFVIVKNKELSLLQDFCKSRVAMVDNVGCNWKASYSPYETSIFDELKYLNTNHYSECVEYVISEYSIDEKILNKFNFIWLAGFIDGDGCITISKIRRPGGSYQYQPMIHVVTGSPLAKNILSTFFDLHNIDYYLKKSLPGVNHKENCKSKKFEFYIRSHGMCIKLLNLLNNNFIGKHDRAKALKSFCESRITDRHAYTESEINHYTFIHNDIKDTSTTKSKTSFNKDEDIV